MKRRFRSWVTGAGLVLAASLIVAEIERPIYLDKEGRALPIQQDKEILSFLESAKVTASKKIPVGVTNPVRLDLQWEDVRARAVFHNIIVNKPNVKRMANGRVRAYRRDHFTSQIAAYELGRMLQVHNIPPTTSRHFNGLDGSAQLWIENAITEEQRQGDGVEPPDWSLWNQLYADMRIFDNLVNNIDRNLGNMLIDSQGQLWLIDHTRSFGKDKTIPNPETITRCSHRLYNALQSLDEDQVEKRMETMRLLAPGEIKAIFHRRTELLERIDDRIRLLGEDQVLFDYGDPEPGIEVDEDAG